MQISPVVPLIGLLLVIINVLAAAVTPVFPPRFMGVQLFVAGMTTLLLSVIDLINPIGITDFERFFLFFAGCVNCAVGYYMVLLDLRRRGV